MATAAADAAAADAPAAAAAAAGEACAKCPKPVERYAKIQKVHLRLLCEECANSLGGDLITKTDALKRGVALTELGRIQYRSKRNPYSRNKPAMRLYIKAEVGVLAEECAAVREQLHQQKLQQLTIQANARRSRLGLDHSDVLPDVHDAVFGDYLTPVQKPKTLRRDARRARTLVPLVVAAAALIQPRAAAPGCGPPRADLRAAVLRFATERGAAAPGEADVAAAAAAALADALMARVELTRAMLAAGAEHVLSALTATDAAAARSALPGLAAAAAAAADPADALRNELVRGVQAAPPGLAASIVANSGSGASASKVGGSSTDDESSDADDGSSGGGSASSGGGGGGGANITPEAAADALLNDKAVARRLQDFREFRLHPGATAQGLVRFAAGRGDAAARRAELAAAMARLGTDVNEVNRCARAQQRRTQFETGAADLDADEVAAMLQLDAKLGGLALSTAMLERASADMEREYRRQVYQFGHSSKEALRVARKRLTTARRDAWVPMSCRSFSGFYDY